MGTKAHIVTTEPCPMCGNHLYYNTEDFIYYCPECKFTFKVWQAIRTLERTLEAKHEATESENLILRRMLWFNHSTDCFPYLYGDDGEMQCNKCMIDFKRDQAHKIERRLIEIRNPDYAAALERIERYLEKLKEATKI